MPVPPWLPLPRRAAIALFLVFAFAYFLSALLRAVTATLAPVLANEFGLHAGDLGLLSGGYFLGFAATQLPLGTWLDRHGPRRVLLGFLGAAVLGCLLFSLADGFVGLWMGRVLCGAGLGACLMAPLTGYRRWLSAAAQLRANAWMMMTGSLGMVASTLPVQWLLPLVGWRPLFWGLAALIVLAMGWIARGVPDWNPPPSEAVPALDAGRVLAPVQQQKTAAAAPHPSSSSSPSASLPPALPVAPADNGYAAVWRHPYFWRMAPLGFFLYGGMVAVQTLWAGPWMQQVAGYSALESATGLFWINVSMLCTFWLWGLVGQHMVRRQVDNNRLMAAGLPVSLVVLAAAVWLGEQAGAAVWALYCVSCTFIALSLPTLAQAFPQALAGRALSAYNLVIFGGVFVVQWGIGLLVDAFAAHGATPVQAFRGAMVLYLACNVAAYAWFLLRAPRHNAVPDLAAP